MSSSLHESPWAQMGYCAWTLISLSFLSLLFLNLGAGNIWLDNVACRGTEMTLWSCNKNKWGSHNCNHNEDAGVDCRWPSPAFVLLCPQGVCRQRYSALWGVSRKRLSSLWGGVINKAQNATTWQNHWPWLKSLVHTHHPFLVCLLSAHNISLSFHIPLHTGTLESQFIARGRVKVQGDLNAMQKVKITCSQN